MTEIPSGKALCGVDFGLKRIGLAISDPMGILCSPLCAVSGEGAMADVVNRITESVDGYGIGGWIVGLPLNMDGTEGDQAKQTRAFGTKLGTITGLPVEYQDERLTSCAADELLQPGGFTHKKKKARRDAVAAQIILETWLQNRNLNQGTQ